MQRKESRRPVSDNGLLEGEGAFELGLGRKEKSRRRLEQTVGISQCSL